MNSPLRTPAHRRRPLASGLTVASLLLCALDPSRALAQDLAGKCSSDVRTIALTPQAALATPRKTPRYTQGLAIHEDQLFEGAGMFGHSGLHRSKLDGSQPTPLAALDKNLFGEGLTIHKGQAFYLTWRSRQAYVYDLQDDGTLSPASPPTRSYEGEGWGLTTDGEVLVMSDGSATLRLLRPDDFTVIERLEVRAGGRAVRGLNELEMIGDQVLANLYGPPVIVVIDRATGCVRTALDASPLARAMQTLLPKGEAAICGSFGCTASDYVLNGIAYDEVRDQLYVTGKNWPRFFVFANPLNAPAQP